MTSVLLAVTGRGQAAGKAIAAWLRSAAASDEVLVAVPAGRPRLRAAVEEAVPDDPRVVVVPVAGARGVADLWRAGADRATGDVLVLADGTGRPTDDAVPVLAEAVRSGAAVCGIPALDADDSLTHAGHVPSGPGHPPAALLAGQPPEDLAELAPGVEVPLLATAPVALARPAAATLDGITATDPAAVVAALTVDGAWLATGAAVRHATGLAEDPGPWPDLPAWTGPALDLPSAGLVVSPGEAGPVLARRPLAAGPAGVPRLRWALVVASPAGRGGEAWGDTHFAADLAAALRRRGQQVAVVRRQGAESDARARDDVVLVLRGLVRVRPVLGPVSVLWVISHPDLVDADEPGDYDVVAAASAGWSARLADRLGRPVHPLLQATDPDRFHPGLAAPDSGADVLFVGSSRRQVRPMVRDALAVGADLAVYGAGWDDLPPGVVRAPFLDPGRVGAAYRSAGVVLNDHWPDMAREGFLSNRLFDAVAAGARVVSDDADGLSEVFGSAVRVVHGADELGAVLAGPRDAIVGDDHARRAAAARIAAEHSFDARAQTLLDLVLAARA